MSDDEKHKGPPVISGFHPNLLYRRSVLAVDFVVSQKVRAVARSGARLTYLFTYSLTDLFTYSLSSLTHFFHLLTYSLLSLTDFLTYLLFHSLTYLFFHLLTYP